LAYAVTRFRLLPLLLLLALVAVPATAPAAAPGKPGATKKRCPAGTTPVVRKKGKRAVPKRDRRGRLRCRAIPMKRPPAPAATPLGQAADVAGALRQTLAVDPGALDRIAKTVGRRRAKRLLAVTLDSWESRAAVARAAQAPQTTTFTPGDGMTGSASFGVEQVTGAESGFTATASVTVSATREGVSKLSSALTDKLPPDVKRATGQLDVSFQDRAAGCPDAAGKRSGSVKATGKVKVKVEREGKPPVEMELAADVEMTYTATSGEDGKVATIDNVDVKTEFRSATTGEATQTYRGHRLATGFGRPSILDSKDWSAALERDGGRFNTEAGGIFGPKGSWNFERGIGAQDLRTIDNVKGMFTAAIATNLLTLAAVEYVRKVALDRLEKVRCGYSVSFVVDGTGIFATHDASGRISIIALDAAQTGPGKWTATAPAAWQNLIFTTKTDCAYVSPVTGGTFSVELQLTPAGPLSVNWSTDAAGGMSTASVDCPGDPHDPPPIPGQPGPALVGIGPMSFELPPEGGSQRLAGGVESGGEGFFNEGTLTVTRTG
jgi:hypothetical protein